MERTIAVDSEESFDNILSDCAKNGSLALVHFWAPWAAQCNNMKGVIEEILKDTKNKTVKAIQVEAESLPRLSQKYKISAVPTFIFIKNEKEIDRLNGANAPELNKKISQHSVQDLKLPSMPVETKKDLNERLKALVNHAPCMLFMKGSPNQPRCGFSKQIIEIFKKHEAEFGSFDILSDEEIRQGLKTYSNWPTYPQIYIKGELIGGLDIVKEMDESGDLAEVLPKKSNFEDKLKKLINQSPVMIFMKGRPEEPRCGFSKTLVGILNDMRIKYDTFDILTDEEVRQGLKTYSNWPTYPQIYVRGDLIGGLDIVKEMHESGELKTVLNPE